MRKLCRNTLIAVAFCLSLSAPLAAQTKLSQPNECEKITPQRTTNLGSVSELQVVNLPEVQTPTNLTKKQLEVLIGLNQLNALTSDLACKYSNHELYAEDYKKMLAIAKGLPHNGFAAQFR